MNNEEPISFSHYPDGQPPNGNAEDEVDQKPREDIQNGENGGRESKQKKKRRKKRPIERDDFPAPPFPYARRRHWSEPMRSSSSEEDDDEDHEEGPVETMESSTSE